jgi:hypothetical protein
MPIEHGLVVVRLLAFGVKVDLCRREERSAREEAGRARRETDLADVVDIEVELGRDGFDVVLRD